MYRNSGWKKKVRFDTSPVYFMLNESTAHCNARIDESWRDALRFKRYVKRVEGIMSPVLSRMHRVKMYSRFANKDDGDD